ncbi:MAG: tyrosine-protein phosphatase [Acutalibacteraceae bacterium]
MNDRSIAFEKIANARELGGLNTENGGIIASGLLIRSANLSEATETDKSILREKYRLAKIIDLRTDLERNERPDAPMADVEYLSIPVFDISVAGISHEKMNHYEEILSVIPKMGQLYGKMVSDSSCRENLGKAARCVMEHDFSKGSVLWHCTEGKDRCGLLSAVLLLALGAERSTIMEDYLLTNRVNAAKSEKYYQMMLSAGKTEREAEVVRDIFLAKEEYLDAAFSAMDAQYGNTDAFLRDGLHIPQKLIEQFQSSVLG